MLNNGREWAGVFIASVVVIAYVGIGFASVLVFLFTGTEIKFPDDWKSAMLSLASAAMGYLIGKSRGDSTTTQSPVVETAETVTVNPARPVNPVATLAVQGVPPIKQ